MRTFPLLTLLAGMLAIAACEDDPTSPAREPAPAFQPLTTREAVVNNLEVAWNKRSTDKFSELLADGFEFYFSPEDVQNGSPLKWDFVNEISVVHELFISNTVPEPEGPRCSSVKVSLLNYDLEWIEVPAQWGAPDDVWYKTTVFYTFSIEMEPNTTFIAPDDAQAELTVMPSGDEWRLVEWRDLAFQESGPVASSGSSAESSWGNIKLMYEPTFLQLVEPNAVLANLEAVWNHRRADKLDELLDTSFKFYFSATDVGNGTPEWWGRPEEFATSEALFTSNQQSTPEFPVCQSVDVNLLIGASQVWAEVIPEEFPDERWYMTTVFYDFVFELDPDVTYISAPASRAQFTVRPVGDQWRLVEWRDVGPSAVLMLADGSQATWGGIKALYQ